LSNGNSHCLIDIYFKIASFVDKSVKIIYNGHNSKTAEALIDDEFEI